MIFKKYPIYYQLDKMDCGPSCLRMVSKYYGKKISLQYLRKYTYLTKTGVSLLGITQGAEKIGFKTLSALITYDEVIKLNKELPAILHWSDSHFIVLYKIKQNIFTKKLKFIIGDPATGLMRVSEKYFKTAWLKDDKQGLILFLETTKSFYKRDVDFDHSISFNYLKKIIKPYKKDFIQILLGLFFTSILSLFFPLLMQLLIDNGVNKKNINIVVAILIAQIVLYIGTISIEIIRNWVVLFLGSIINIKLIEDFLIKILKLPIKFFDTKLLGDFQQRINDQHRIETFLTSTSLITLFSIINFSVFFIVLFYYSTSILLIYTIFTIIAIIWSIYFFKYRKILDYKSFIKQSENSDNIFEIINGAQEIKLNNFETYKIKNWKKTQKDIFNINQKSLKINQLQINGYNFINQIKNIVVTYVAASAVIYNNISLGTMVAISYIIGEMNSPINQLINFFRSLQDAKLSFERVAEIQKIKNEDAEEQISFLNDKKNNIKVNNLFFQYEGPKSPFVLSNINLNIKFGQTIAIVGESGSGKTTLMKLLLKFYEPSKGNILFDNFDINKISAKEWRKQCGIVMQDGYIFSDTIERNIAMETNIDNNKMKNAIKIANLTNFIESLPLKLHTKIGASGVGLSGGQKQRILIARAVYKNPNFIFFDEATSALDSNNELVIYENLNVFFKNKTVIIIAHRLSTVKNANIIIVLKQGVIVEQGNHKELIANKGHYFQLIKNQLELSK